MNILSLCDLSGNMVRPWVEAGHTCTILDLEHSPGVNCVNGLNQVGADVLNWGIGEVSYDIVFAFPPCTHLAVSGARWFKLKGLAKLIEGLQIVEACRVICETAKVFWVLENPVSTLSTYWRKPDYYFDPCDFGGYCEPSSDSYTKKTCLWVGGNFQMPKRKEVAPMIKSPIHHMPPGTSRGRLRSITPMGFAKAVFEANK